MVYEYNSNRNFNYPNLVVFFYAAYNTNCNVNKEMVNNLSNIYKDVVFIQLNTTKHYEMKTYYNINKIPSFLYFSNNNLISKLEGNSSTYTLQKFIESNIRE